MAMSATGQRAELAITEPNVYLAARIAATRMHNHSTRELFHDRLASGRLVTIITPNGHARVFALKGRLPTLSNSLSELYSQVCSHENVLRALDLS